MKIGYARCSTLDQNLDWQVDKLTREGCERIYQEKVSGTKADRPELNRMLDALRAGDTVVVCELTRLSRSTKDLFEIVDRIHAIGADVKSLGESWLDTTTPQGKLLFTIFAGVSQFERDLTKERTMAGLEAARARGRKGGRSKTDPKAVEKAIKLYESKTMTVPEILEITGIKKTTLYAYIKNAKNFNLTGK